MYYYQFNNVVSILEKVPLLANELAAKLKVVGMEL
jgi:hypothetical protein